LRFAFLKNCYAEQFSKLISFVSFNYNIHAENIKKLDLSFHFS